MQLHEENSAVTPPMRSSLVKFYDLAAPVYGFWAALTESRAHRRALAALSGQDILEVAIGNGADLAALAADGSRGRTVGVDLSRGMLKRARRRCGGEAVLCRADARALPFRSGSFDNILNCYMIDLLLEGDIPVVLRELHRVLRPGGRLVLVTMATQSAVVQRTWMALYHAAPLLVGGCRPIDVTRWLSGPDWQLETRDWISQMGFRSELLVALRI
jgi:ubiquinone/menaquinone biosynthesis C-methylase UbiE